MSVHEVIPLRRIKQIVAAALAGRFAPVEKTPSKRAEFRSARPAPSRMEGRQIDALFGMSPAKFAARARKNAKLRLFRIFKLLGQLKSPAASPAAYRPLAERIRATGLTRRL